MQEGGKSEKFTFAIRQHYAKLPVAYGCKGEPGTLPSQLVMFARGFKAG